MTKKEFIISGFKVSLMLILLSCVSAFFADILVEDECGKAIFFCAYSSITIPLVIVFFLLSFASFFLSIFHWMFFQEKFYLELLEYINNFNKKQL